MALGTITQLTDQLGGLNRPVNLGALKVTISTVVGDSAYATGGTTLTAAQLGLGSLAFALVIGVSGSGANNGAVEASYNNSTGKLQMWATTGTSPVGLAEPNSVNLSGITAIVLAFGTD